MAGEGNGRGEGKTNGCVRWGNVLLKDGCGGTEAGFRVVLLLLAGCVIFYFVFLFFLSSFLYSYFVRCFVLSKRPPIDRLWFFQV